MKLNIVLMIQGLAGGGAERVVVDLARQYKDQGHNVVVVSLYAGGPREEELKASGIQYKVFERSGYFGFTMMNQIEDYLKSFKPDILHTHMFAAFARGALLGKRLGIPVVHTLHNMRLEDSFVKKVVRKFFNKQVSLVAVSDAVKRDYAKRFSVNPEKISVIENGIDIASYPFAVSEMNKNVVGFAGRLEDQKACDVLIRAMVDVPGVLLKIVGDGALLSTLKKQAATLGIRNRVSFLGWIPNMDAFYRSIDVLVIPSRWEGFGLVAIEAMASGVPVIASDVDGLSEIIEDYRTGRLVESENSKDFADAIEWAYAYPDKMQSYAKAARDVVIQKYSSEKMVESYLDIYQNVSKKEPNKVRS